MLYPKPKKTRQKKSRIVDREALKRAVRDTCQMCDSPHRLQIHHIKYKSQGGGDTDDNLICLCGHCHDIAHGKVRGEYLPADILRKIKEADLREF